MNLTTLVQDTTQQAGTPVWYEGFPDNRMAPWAGTALGASLLGERTGPYPYPVKAPPLGLRALGQVGTPMSPWLKFALLVGAIYGGYLLCRTSYGCRMTFRDPAIDFCQNTYRGQATKREACLRRLADIWLPL